MTAENNDPADVTSDKLALRDNGDALTQTLATIGRAVLSGDVEIEKVQALMELQKELLADQARKEYVAALANFQRQCPPIIRSRQVQRKGGGLLYAYAPLDSIVSQTRDLLAECNFAWRFETRSTDAGVAVDCVVMHGGGHRESTTINVPPTTGQHTNAAQNAGIAITYGQRYAFISAFGIVLADDDTDARGEHDLAPITAEQVAEIKSLALAAKLSGDDKRRLLSAAGVDAIEKIPASEFATIVAGLRERAKRAT